MSTQCQVCHGDLWNCRHNPAPTFGFEDIRKGDKLRITTGDMVTEGVADRTNNSGGQWFTALGYSLVGRDDSPKNIELVERPRLQEPQMIGAIVWARIKGARGRLNWTRINKGPSERMSWVSQNGDMATWDNLDVESIKFEGTVL